LNFWDTPVQNAVRKPKAATIHPTFGKSAAAFNPARHPVAAPVPIVTYVKR